MSGAGRIAAFRAQCGGPRDGALLRFGLASALLEEGQAGEARTEFERALAFDPQYSAAWKLLGKACQAEGDATGARAAWQRGIEVATARGDQQAAREMGVFVRRLEKAGDQPGGLS